MQKGINGSAGIGMGNAVIIREQDLTFDEDSYLGEEQELVKLDQAMAVFAEKTELLAKRMEQQIGEKEAAILRGHIILADDPEIYTQLKDAILGGKSAEASVVQVFDFFAQIFESTGDELTMQRATDLRDIKTRLLAILLQKEEIDISQVPEGTILIAKDLTPSMTTGLNTEHVAGILTETGGRTSHSAILARALEIPAVLSVAGICELANPGDFILMDGNTGEVWIDPEQEVIDAYRIRQEQEKLQREELKKLVGRKTQTKDKTEKELFANIGSAADVEKVMASGGEGIGLFRTEFLFMNRTDIPTEEEQFQAYRTVAEAMQGKEVIIRTMDIGGDKEVPALGMDKEENPFLGFRAIRYCLRRKEIYQAQLRAILRASAFGNIKIMIPLVTGVDELRQVKKMVAEIAEELDNKKIEYQKEIEVGVMMETPAACLMADILAKEAAFFSIGTNDLTGYTMAADRGNANVSYLCSSYQPPVLRAIASIIASAKKEGIKVGMCGEAAADIRMIPLLLGFGLDEFSVSASAILRTRKVIADWSIADAKNLADRVMEQSTEAEVCKILESV